MRFVFLLTVCMVTVVSACQSAESNDPKVFARKLMHDAGQDSAKITKVVSGDKKYRHADELWCIATDASLEDGQVPYLLAVWRKGGQWDGAQLTEGYYEWDLAGCSQ